MIRALSTQPSRHAASSEVKYESSFIVTENESNDQQRLADFLRIKLHLSPKHIQRSIQNGFFSVNHQVRTHTSALLSTGDVVTFGATAFAIDRLRFATPLLRLLHKTMTYMILWKPAGMPIGGNDSETVEKALPGSMDHDQYHVVDSVGRIMSGPVLVSLEDDHRQLLLVQTVPKRYTFQCIVHGIPPDCLDMDGFCWLRKVQTTATTTGHVLSTIQVMLTHSGDGLRGCLARVGNPIFGTSAKIKSNSNGCFVACIRLELMWNNSPTTVVTMEAPEKFQSTIEREQRFYLIKQQRELEQVQLQQELRKAYVKQRGDLTPEEELANNWSVTSFAGLTFYVTDDVMIPKPSSEILIHSAKDNLSLAINDDHVSVLDLGTGSGCLLISVLATVGHDNVQGVGVDISAEALSIAKINVQYHRLSDRVVLKLGDFGDLSVLGDNQTFDVILCNPPYLTEGECIKDGLIGPLLALVADDHGLGCYKMVASQVEALLKPHGVIVLEVGGKRNVDEIRAIFGCLEFVDLKVDHQGHGRCLILRRMPKLNLTLQAIDVGTIHQH